jgi:cell division septum initiation protein DivIVA
VNMQADTILKNAQLKAEGIIEQARRKANTMEEHLESVKYRKKLMHVESVINSDQKLIDAYKTAEKRLAEQKPTRNLSRGMEPPTR